MRRVGREGLQIDVVCPGNPALAAEGLLLLDESWPGFYGRWSIKTVKSRGSAKWLSEYGPGQRFVGVEASLE